MIKRTVRDSFLYQYSPLSDISNEFCRSGGSGPKQQVREGEWR